MYVPHDLRLCGLFDSVILSNSPVTLAVMFGCATCRGPTGRGTLFSSAYLAN